MSYIEINEIINDNKNENNKEIYIAKNNNIYFAINKDRLLLPYFFAVFNVVQFILDLLFVIKFKAYGEQYGYSIECKNIWNFILGILIVHSIMLLYSLFSINRNIYWQYLQISNMIAYLLAILIKPHMSEDKYKYDGEFCIIFWKEYTGQFWDLIIVYNYIGISILFLFFIIAIYIVFSRTIFACNFIYNKLCR
jgi:hypothetical protein